MMKVTRDTIRHLPQQQQQPLLYNVYVKKKTHLKQVVAK